MLASATCSPAVFGFGLSQVEKNLPLIRLSAINPFLSELRRRGKDPKSLLEDHGLPTNIPASHDLFVASETIYALVERSAELADDKFLGFEVGSALELQSWDPIAHAVNKAKTVGELLTLFAMHASDHSTATKFSLHMDGDRSTFGFERTRQPPFCPGQNDAFYLGFMSRLLSHATRDHWDPAKVMFRVAEPDYIPGASQAYRVARCDWSGIRITFPTRWLLERFQKSNTRSAPPMSVRGAMPLALLDSVRSALQPHLHDSNLTVEKAAKICGYQHRRLTRELREKGTTLSNVIANLRAEKAERDLVNTDRRVAEIAQSVGFTDPTVFSRAFKKWTGQSPQQYRQTHNSPE